MLQSIIDEARPKQWLKNVLVFAAPGAAGVLNQPRLLMNAIIAFIALCLAASGTYFWNDIMDVEADRQHPTKARRPVASGTISLGTARAVGTVLLLAAPATMALTGHWKSVGVVVLYIVVTLTYSALWKHVAVIDLIVISSGFVLRAIAGAYSVDVPMSSWFLLVTAFGSMFIVTGKRYAEANQLGDAAGAVRVTLEDYTANFLRFVLGVACSAALVSYCLWAFDVKSTVDPDLPLLELSVVPFVTSLFRYALVLETGRGAAPEEVFSSDRVLQVLGILWIALFAGAVYL